MVFYKNLADCDFILLLIPSQHHISRWVSSSAAACRGQRASALLDWESQCWLHSRTAKMPFPPARPRAPGEVACWAHDSVHWHWRLSPATFWISQHVPVLLHDEVACLVARRQHSHRRLSRGAARRCLWSLSMQRIGVTSVHLASSCWHLHLLRWARRRWVGGRRGRRAAVVLPEKIEIDRWT